MRTEIRLEEQNETSIIKLWNVNVPNIVQGSKISITALRTSTYRNKKDLSSTDETEIRVNFSSLYYTNKTDFLVAKLY